MLWRFDAVLGSTVDCHSWFGDCLFVLGVSLFSPKNERPKRNIAGIYFVPHTGRKESMVMMVMAMMMTITTTDWLKKN